MSEPFPGTLGACVAGYAALVAAAPASSAVSSEALALSRAASAVVNQVERSEVLFGTKRAAIVELHKLAIDAVADGGEPLHPLALRQAETFLRVLPDDLPMPQLATEPDGCVSLDWIATKRCLISVSFGPSNRLAFAWVDGSEKGYGVVGFDGLTVPLRLREVIGAIVPSTNAAFRFV